jgi:lipooligosaccharide transport system ATP-binding protein
MTNDESDEPVVAARGVTKRFGPDTAVDELDLTVPRGICFGLLGPNGAGKTTTLRMVYGVTRPSAGCVRVFGIDVAENPRAVRARLGVTLQENVLVENLNSRENLRVFGRFHLLRGARLERRVEEVIEVLDLGSRAELPVQALSGGFQRRLSIALSLMSDPELLVLDEPTTGLDPAVRLSLWSRVRELRAAGKTVLLTTHYMDEAERLCDRIAIMAKGRAVSEGSPAELIGRHLAREAVELDCTPDEEAALLEGFERPPLRTRAGSRLMLYAADTTALVERIHKLDGGDRRPLVVRPSNLEDVFLTVTGTSLEEDET